MPSVELLKAAIQHVNDGVVIAEYKASDDHPILFVNPRFEQITGYTAAELVGKDCRWLKGDDSNQHALDELKDALASGRPCSVVVRNYNKQGRMFWNQVNLDFVRNDQNITHVISINKDITQEEYAKNVLDKVNVLYREMSKRLEFTNETDKLTQLKNRSHLSTRGEFILGTAKREKLRLHAILVDVDNFDLFNGLGSHFADQSLVSVAEVIRRYFCRATDIAIRLSDDQFFLLCIEDEDRRIVERAEMLRTEVHSLTLLDDKQNPHTLSVSIGIYSVNPEKHTTIDEMIHIAGQLIFQEGHVTRNHIEHFKESSATPS